MDEAETCDWTEPIPSLTFLEAQQRWSFPAEQTIFQAIIEMILLHGTTRWRGEQIIILGPDPRYRESGGQDLVDGFSTNVEEGPFLFGTPEEYARGKARAFPDEGGAVILVIDVPVEIVQKAINDWFPLSQGLIQFDLGSGLEELIAVWPEVSKSAHLRSVT